MHDGDCVSENIDHKVSVRGKNKRNIVNSSGGRMLALLGAARVVNSDLCHAVVSPAQIRSGGAPERTQCQ